VSNQTCRGLIIAFGTLAQAGCAAQLVQPDFAEREIRYNYVRDNGSDNLSVAGPGAAASGLEALRADRPDEANRLLNEALKLNPRDPLLNFLNGFAYESGSEGAGERRELARVGYQLALQFDPNFWPAAVQLGHLALADGDARAAQLHFARAALLAPNRAEPFYGLAAASYAAADLATARSALDRAMAVEAPGTPDLFRVAAVVNAATGNSDGARVMLASLETMGDPAAPFTANRIAVLEENFTRLAQATIPAGPQLLQGPAEEPAYVASAVESMVNIDVIIIQREETATTRRGVNLLDGLRMQFGSTLIQSDSSRVTDFGTTTFDRQTETSGLSLSLSGVNYSLNIANSSDGFSRIEARPTLLAYDGQTSRYFNGGEVTYAVGGEISAGSFTKPVGLTLAVTPIFNEDGYIDLTVFAELSNFVLAPPPGTFREAVATTKAETEVSASMTYGQTMVISAGTSTLESRVTSGVPLLRDLPVLQNMFSTDSDTVRESSLVMLLTLRRPTLPEDFLSADGPFGDVSLDPAALENLRTRYAQWFEVPSTLASALTNVSREGAGVVFRSGDVRLSNPADAARAMASGERRNRFLEDVATLFYY